ncbi:MAG: dipeptidase [Planctomycetota bacterium]
MSDEPETPTRRRRVRWGRCCLVLLLGLGLLGALFAQLGGTLVDRALNRALVPPPYEVSEEARALHERILVADLHADSLMWDRDLLERHTHGLVDLPRLVDGNVALQVFTMPTRHPLSNKQQGNPSDSPDMIAPLVWLNGWPAEARSPLFARARYMSERFADAVARSEGGLVPVRTQAELAAFLELRAERPQAVAGILGVEGGHCLDGELANLDALFELGVRTFGPTHFFDNRLGGSAHGESLGGLTEFGRQVIQRIDELGMIVDLSHASPALVEDVLALTERPLLVSHTGVQGTQPGPRNLSDEQLQRVAEHDGLIGIAFFAPALPEATVAEVVRAIRYTADLVGVEHVALGSDFDGSVRCPVDVSGLVEITEALLADGFSPEEAERIMGQNAFDFFARALPE